MRKLRTILFTTILAFAFLAIHTAPVHAIFGLEYKWVEIVDEEEDTITSGMTYEVQDTNGNTLTLYQNRNSTASTVTNPGSVSNLDNPGLLTFYTSVDSFNLKLTDSDGHFKTVTDVDSAGRVRFISPMDGWEALTITTATITGVQGLDLTVGIDTTTVNANSAGILAIDSDYNLYISTAAGVTSWKKLN